MIIIGTLFHALTAFLIALAIYKVDAPIYLTVPLLLAFAYALKELGEAKSKTVGMGKITSWSRNRAMLLYVFTQPKIIVQWAAAGVAAYIAWVV